MESNDKQPQSAHLKAKLSILEIDNKRMTIAIFNQLYQQAPFDSDFNLLYPIWGIVNRNVRYAVFNTEFGLRKYDLSFLPEIYSSSIEQGVLKSIDNKKEFYELKHCRQEVIGYFLKLNAKYEYDENDYYENDLRELLNRRYYKKSVGSEGKILPMPGDLDVVSKALDPHFKGVLEVEHKKGTQLLEKRTALIEQFEGAVQLFIGR